MVTYVGIYAIRKAGADGYEPKEPWWDGEGWTADPAKAAAYEGWSAVLEGYDVAQGRAYVDLEVVAHPTRWTS